MTTIALSAFNAEQPTSRALIQRTVPAVLVILLHVLILLLLLTGRIADQPPQRTAFIVVTIREAPQLPRQPSLPLWTPQSSTRPIPLPSAPELAHVEMPRVGKGIEMPSADFGCDAAPTALHHQLMPCIASTGTPSAHQPVLSAELMQKFAHDKEIEDTPLAAPCFSQRLGRFTTQAC